MNVVKRLSLLFVCLYLVACDKNDDSSAATPFIKSDRQNCDDQQVKGEYLVYWKNGQISVESAPSEGEFIENFIASHRDEILKAEPHYQIRLETQLNPQNSSSLYGGEINWGIDQVEAQQLWNKSLAQDTGASRYEDFHCAFCGLGLAR